MTETLSHTTAPPFEEGEHSYSAELVRIAIVLLAAVAVWVRVWDPIRTVSVIGLAAALLGGYPIYREAFDALRERRMTMELSMTIAIFAALLIAEFLTALIIIAFVLGAEILEEITVGRGRRAIHDLLDLLPSVATVQTAGGAIQDRPLEEVRIGDLVLAKPGCRIAVDGTVVNGDSSVDQSPITGESMPVEKYPGCLVYAGTINQTGILEIQTERIGRNTAFGRIIAAVEQAERQRAPIQKTADTLSGYLVYFALGCSALTFALTRDPRSTISVIIVAGACGIAAGTPLAILGGIGRAARQGAIIKGGRYLEAMWRVNSVVLDKTGTLTFGSPQVVAVQPAPGVSIETLMGSAVTAELPSEHPIARAIVAKGESFKSRKVGSFQYLPGKGIRCVADGKVILAGNRAFLIESGISRSDAAETDSESSRVLIAEDGQFLGIISLADTLRPEAADAVRQLRSMGIHTTLLSGDHRSVGEAVGKQLGVDEIGTELLPEQKMEWVRRLMAKDEAVMMVGDGINDAPALMAATVGVAMGSGTDVARETAHVLLLGNNLLDLVRALRTARRVRRIIFANFVGTLLVDGLGVLLAALGFLNPLIAAFIHVTSELVFILNSARLLKPESQT